MPHGGESIEIPPATCPHGHRWGAPVGGITLYLTGHRPCSCPASLAVGRHGHRTFVCCRPGCDAVIERPVCDGPSGGITNYAKP